MKKWKIGVIADCLRLPFAESMAACAKLGADGVQMYAVEGEMAPENMTPAAVAEKRRILEENGLAVSALCGDLGGHGFERREENPAKIERSKRIVDLAVQLGAPVVTTHIRVIPADRTAERYQIMQEACNQLAEYACRSGVRFAVETGSEPAERLGGFWTACPPTGLRSISTPPIW